MATHFAVATSEGRCFWPLWGKTQTGSTDEHNHRIVDISLVKTILTTIPEVLLIKPCIFRDERGAFWKSFNQRRFCELTGVDAHFVQDNQCISRKGVLRGLHYQIRKPQAKLIRVVVGEVFDVTVDVRRASPTFGQWVGNILSAENRHEMWIPPGFAHGFLTLSSSAEVLYKVTDYYARECERSIF